ncbi:hypothetical protein AVDCRST_MAG84-3616 [uncultured Microcoleus sp.]|uniref:Uncharacterized protein n=1 Tax=uncultured Microcoleus sp. TaxID=259945 RepID=A0A6J4MP90_9CYAN|nr:hypothetical protein AVDCRST_MAG84-3616 [uncultured Microcoleus sp.]
MFNNSRSEPESHFSVFLCPLSINKTWLAMEAVTLGRILVDSYIFGKKQQI